MRILITGGTGLIGRALCRALTARGDQLTVLSRHPERVPALCGAGVQAWRTLDAWGAVTAFDAVINLAGEPIIDRRWSARQKATLLASRVGTTQRLVQLIAQRQRRPAVLISGSAIGLYGVGAQQRFDEASPAGGDFPAQLCQQWEAAALAAVDLGLRVVLLRTGLVLSDEGGLLQRVALPTRWGLGAILGDGRQWMSWIDIDDHVSAVLHLLDDATASGPYNLVAPAPVTHEIFVKAVASALHRPCLLRSPAWLLRRLLGERATLLTEGQQVLPTRLQACGFRFRHPELASSLARRLGAGPA